MSRGPIPPPETVATIFWPPPAPQIGQSVLYRLSDDDARAIARQRLGGRSRPTPARAGDVFPAIVVRASAQEEDVPCNLQVLLDGPDTYWARDIRCGTDAGTWSWPARAGG
ncbi:hypothetical protein AB0912_15650 [Streptomyces sp. NPDC007084]|uniref:hypothetical protein n=1 Tax=Streptomyces sp. NPDC007084 TaxID=3154313 RepID=UPI003456C978